jgi:hypothetical protein
MGTIMHVGISVRGALSQSKRVLGRMFNDKKTGRRLSAEEAREQLYDFLAQGFEYIPMGECDNWDPKSGCKGHPSPDK